MACRLAKGFSLSTKEKMCKLVVVDVGLASAGPKATHGEIKCHSGFSTIDRSLPVVIVGEWLIGGSDSNNMIHRTKLYISALKAINKKEKKDMMSAEGLSLRCFDHLCHSNRTYFMYQTNDSPCHPFTCI